MVPARAESADKCCSSLLVDPINWDNASCNLLRTDKTEAMTPASAELLAEAENKDFIAGLWVSLKFDKAVCANEVVTSTGHPEFHYFCQIY